MLVRFQVERPQRGLEVRHLSGDTPGRAGALESAVLPGLTYGTCDIPP